MGATQSAARMRPSAFSTGTVLGVDTVVAAVPRLPAVVGAVERRVFGFDERVETDADAAIGEGNDRSVPHGRIFPDFLDEHWRKR